MSHFYLGYSSARSPRIQLFKCVLLKLIRFDTERKHENTYLIFKYRISIYSGQSKSKLFVGAYSANANVGWGVL